MLANIDPEIGLHSLIDGLDTWERHTGTRPVSGWNPECGWSWLYPRDLPRRGFRDPNRRRRFIPIVRHARATQGDRLGLRRARSQQQECPVPNGTGDLRGPPRVGSPIPAQPARERAESDSAVGHALQHPALVSDGRHRRQPEQADRDPGSGGPPGPLAGPDSRWGRFPHAVCRGCRVCGHHRLLLCQAVRPRPGSSNRRRRVRSGSRKSCGSP